MSEEYSEHMPKNLKTVMEQPDERTSKKQAPGAITYARGFTASGVRAGIKEKGEDVALIYSEKSCSVAGLFTTNLVKAAPVLVSKSRVPRGTGRAVVANAGNANACTGKQGMAGAREMTSRVASQLGLDEDDVFVASTGVIGHKMPMDKIRSGIDEAVKSLSEKGGEAAMRAIMTTDTRPKEWRVSFSVGGKEVRMGGIAKGAGMIDPNVATMLSFITTDAAITPEMLQKALRHCADVSYNCLTVDGDTSTNDTVIAMANGLAGNETISSEGPDYETFLRSLEAVTKRLAMMIAADGEGATKLVYVTVEGAGSDADCRRIAKTIANSPLVKTALFGKDPNWGRVLAAAGRAGAGFDVRKSVLRFGEIELIRGGEPTDYSPQEAHEYLEKPEVALWLSVGDEPTNATVWTCDFSYDYVRINAEYHT